MRNKTHGHERFRSSVFFRLHQTPDIFVLTTFSDYSPQLCQQSCLAHQSDTLSQKLTLAVPVPSNSLASLLIHTTMVAILSLLYVIPALLSITPSSATLSPGVEVPSPLDIRLARIAANRSHVLQPPAPSGTKAILASRQYNPRKRPIKRRVRGRAVPSSEPVPNTIYANGVTQNKFYEGSGFTESDDNPGKSFMFP